MKIKSLDTIPVEEVISCFLKAFEGYFVKLPEDVSYWKTRFFTARVNWDLSFGMFDDNKLVGFIINGIDRHNGKLTAYNTGTGILQEYRGKAIGDQLYAHAIPQLKERGIEKCLLEVICENEIAQKVYKRIGFNITRELKSFHGKLPEATSKKRFQKCHFREVLEFGLYRADHYSWDNSAEAVEMSKNIEIYCLKTGNSPEAYLLLDPLGNIIQLESSSKNFQELLGAAGALVEEVQIKNVDKGRKELIETLEKFNFSNPVNQFEMEMFL